MKYVLLVLITTLILTGCSTGNNGPTYVIQKQSIVDPTRWDDVIDVYGFSDDYSVTQEITNFLKNDGGNYRFINK